LEDVETLMANELAEETSPYLLQHKDNPVHWLPWGEAALARAKSENRPILLSVGYTACHWCHVMAHESFEDQATADVMNERFVCIKVDREERPDIDAIYQQALQLMGEQGGWPLTMFLTPDMEPYWGGTYFPPEPRYGRPGFPDLLRQLHEVWQSRPETVAKNTQAIGSALGRLAKPPEGPAPEALADGGLTVGLMDTAARQILGIVDHHHGGLQGAPKFPQTSLFDFVWRAARRTGDQDLADAVTLTLDRMCQGGIYDHLGGGFSRYSTDEVWLAPHFEKMLYDNALLIELLTSVWRDTESPLYKTRIYETIDWAMREMRAEGGGFTAALDADSEGEEGRFYVWHTDEIAELLEDGAAAFCAAYDVAESGNWEGKTILNRTQRPALLDQTAEDALAAQRQVLLARRGSRIRPGRDDKVLADWNGLMIAALAEASATFDEADWLQAAEEAFTYVTAEMAPADGLLYHSACGGRCVEQAFLDDYANMARAALALYEATGSDQYLAYAQSWVATLLSDYKDPDHGGFFFTSAKGEKLICRTRSGADNATPAGNGVAAGVLARLFYQTGDDAYRREAQAVICAFAGELARNFIAVPTLMVGAELLEHAVQIVVIGKPNEPDTDAMVQAAYQAAEPNRLLKIVAPEVELRADHPAFGKVQTDGRATAYICRGPVCSPPVDQPAALAQQLASA